MKHMHILALLMLAVSLGPVGAASATTYYVDGEHGDDAYMGVNWKYAFQTLQMALRVAASGDEIWVKTGTYYPDEGPGQKDDQTSATFDIRSGVRILGGFDGAELYAEQRDPIANPTILSGDIDQDDLLDADNARHVITADSVDATTHIDGFIIEMGYGKKGAGIHATKSGLAITQCIIRDHFTEGPGAALHITGRYGENIRMILHNCSIMDSNCGRGTPVHINDAAVIVAECNIYGDISLGGAEPVRADYSSDDIVIVDCKFNDSASADDEVEIDGDTQ